MKVFLEDGATLPSRAYPTDAGLDLYSREDKTILGYGGSAIFDTGVHIGFDKGTWGKIESKSGLNCKHSVVSCGGVIDESYVGSIAVKLYNFGDKAYEVHKGDKIAQIVILRYEAPQMEVVDHLDDTDRGSNGFGSTGR